MGWLHQFALSSFTTDALCSSLHWCTCAQWRKVVLQTVFTSFCSQQRLLPWLLCTTVALSNLVHSAQWPTVHNKASAVNRGSSLMFCSKTNWVNLGFLYGIILIIFLLHFVSSNRIPFKLYEQHQNVTIF